MGKKRITTYTFDASAKTITFSGALDIEGFSVITNVVDNIIVYQFNDPLLGGTFDTNTLTLTYDTTSMGDTDELMILYDDGVETTTVDGTVTANLSATDNAVLDDIASDTEAIKGSLATAGGLVVNLGANNDVTVTGSVTADLGANNDVTVTSGAITETNSSTIKTAVELIDNAISGNEMQVDVLTMPTTTVQATNLDVRDLVQTSDAVAVYGSDDGGTTKRIIKTDSGGAIQVDLEVANVTVNNSTGASAVNIQDGGNSITVDGGVTANAGTNLNTSALALEAGGNLAAIKAKTDNIPALGQALAAASVPVILPAATVTTLTPPAAITGFATSAKQDTIITHVDGIEGSVDGIEGLLTTIDGDTGNIATSTALLDDTVYTDGAGTPSKGLLVLGSDGTNPQALSTDSSGNLQVEVLSAPTTAVTGTFWQVTQPISGTVTANLSATDNAVLDDIAANQTDASQKTQISDGAGNAVTVTGNKLDVNASVDTTGLATSAKQDDIITAIGDIPGGGGVQYVEDDAAAANPTGTAINLIRADTPDAVTTTDGDNLSARGTNKGELYVKHIDAIPVTDNGGALTVDGTVAVTNAGITTIAGAVAGTEMQVDVLTLPSVTGTVTANAGTNLNTSTLALEAGGNLAAIKAKTDNIPALGQALAAASVPVILPAATVTTLTPPAAITGFATSAKQDTIIDNVDGIEGLLTTIDADTGTIAGKDFATQTTLAAMNAKMVTGIDIGDVTINNAAGAAAVNIQDGGNAITVDGSVTLGANTGVDIGKLTANQSVNNAQINGVTPLMGAGNTGTGSQRVTIATDQAAVASKAAINTYVDGSIVTIGAKTDAKSTATDTTAVTAMQVLKQISYMEQNPASRAVTNAGTFATQATLAAETTKVIGTVNIAASQTIGLAAGTAGIGKLTANSGVDIGDVDVLSLPALAAGTAIIGKVGHDITGIGHGVKVVTTAGTDVALAASTACKKVDIQAQTDNTGLIAVGGSGVDATEATGTGILLEAGDIYTLEIDDLADVYIDSTVSGEGVRFTYYS